MLKSSGGKWDCSWQNYFPLARNTLSPYPAFLTCFCPNYPKPSRTENTVLRQTVRYHQTPSFLPFTEAPTFISHAGDGSKFLLRNYGIFSHFAVHNPRTKPPPSSDRLASCAATRLVRLHGVWSWYWLEEQQLDSSPAWEIHTASFVTKWKFTLGLLTELTWAVVFLTYGQFPYPYLHPPFFIINKNTTTERNRFVGLE